MSDTQVNTTLSPTCMESVNRITKLPVVESSIHAATSVYDKIKDYNSLTQWTCTTAETVVTKAVEVGRPIATPIVQGLEGPIRKVDGVLCSGLDYVENKVPAMKLPPGEILCQIYHTTKDYVNNTVTPAVGAAYSYVEPTVKSAYEKIEPAVESAKTVVEPAVGIAYTLVEPAIEKAKSLVEPVVESVKQYGQQKLDEFRKCTGEHSKGDLECEECKAAASEMGEH